MSTNKGMVAKIKGNRCLIITADGEFKNIPLPPGPVQVGKIIEYTEPRRLPWFRPILIAASFFIIFLGLYVYRQLQPAGPLFYLTLDINPSIRLGLNHQEEVIEATPLNRDGQLLLANLSFKGRKYDSVVEDLVGQARQKGFLKKEEDNIIVASLYSPTPTAKGKAKGLAIKKVIDRSLVREKLKAEIMVYQVDDQVWEEAGKAGLSPGKIAFSRALKAQGIELTQEQLKKNSIKKLLRDPAIKAKLAKILPTVPAAVYGRENRDTGSDTGLKNGSDTGFQGRKRSKDLPNKILVLPKNRQFPRKSQQNQDTKARENSEPKPGQSQEPGKQEKQKTLPPKILQPRNHDNPGQALQEKAKKERG